MGNNSVPKFFFRLSRFPVYRGSVLGRFYCIKVDLKDIGLKAVAADRDMLRAVVNTAMNPWFA